LSDIWVEKTGASNIADQLWVARLEQLHNCPHSDMLKRSVGTAQEPIQVFMHPAIGFIPDIIERGVVICGCSAICRIPGVSNASMICIEERTFGRQIAESSRAIPLYFGAW
jgi:hypothetical protein